MILFLDFDGVMHGVNDVEIEYASSGIEYSGKNLFKHLPLLAEVLDEFPEAIIAVSSSWRHHLSLDELRELFGKHGSRIVAITNNVDVAGELPANRFKECRAISEIRGISNWLMIDDQPGAVWGTMEPTPDQQAHLLLCDPDLGLATPGVLDKLRQWLATRQAA